MTKNFFSVLIFLVTLILHQTSGAQAPPVSPKASQEAKALLKFLYNTSGKGILSGQHNAPLNGANRLAGLHKQVGAYPAVFGQDFGFSERNSWDGINFRQRIVDEAIAKHKEGYINTLMWHAISPLHEEPQTFKGSIQAKLTDQQWQELLTPGTYLNERWKYQVDVIAWHLKQLQHANVPVLWRPYHEMNGDWFWWGYRSGEEGYAELWKMLYQRLVVFHKLNNLIWVWNANELRNSAKEYDGYYPGHDFVDVLATDVYSGHYNQKDYQQLLRIGEGRPIALGEVGKFPSVKTLESQPKWVWFMSWRDPDNFFWGDRESLDALFQYSKTLTLNEINWKSRLQKEPQRP